jgi:uncharacterized membrane protein (GlpM family)
MIVKLSFESIRETKWSEYATRFVFGGVVTMLAGLIADKFGPEIGGLFLAFPAIFPASASLIEKHEREKKGNQHGRRAAGVDAAGAAMGCIGLMAFAAAAWKLLSRLMLWEILVLATCVWIVSSVIAWIVRKRVL